LKEGGRHVPLGGGGSVMSKGRLEGVWEIGLKVMSDGLWEMALLPYFDLIIGSGNRLCELNSLNFLTWL